MQPEPRSPIQPQSKINERLGRRPHARERAARRDQRHVRLARLDDDLTASSRSTDDRVVDGPQMLTISVLIGNQLVTSSQDEVRIAELSITRSDCAYPVTS